MRKIFKELLVLIALPLLVLLSGCNSESTVSESKEPPVPEVKLERIDIVASPITTRGVSELTLAKGNKQTFEAVGHYSDGSSQAFADLRVLNWHLSDTDIGRFDVPGALIALESGPTTVSATMDGITSNIVNVTVTDAVITDIQVTPSPVNVAKGQTEQLTATATYSDATSADISNSVTWAPIDTNIATVTTAGLLSGVEVGSTTLTATKDGVTSNAVEVTVSDAVITSIQITPSPVNLAKGQTQQLTVTATFSDDTFSDITSSVIWTLDITYATVTSTGLLSGADVGSTTLTAMKDGVTSNEVMVNVSDAIITSIQVTPSPVNVVKGQTKQLVATATYSDMTSSDISNSVTWHLDTYFATVDSAGLLSGVEVGSTTLTATKDGVTSNTGNVTVSDAIITSIQVTPSPVNVAKGQTQQLVATATYSDMTSADISNSVTWTPVDTNTATVTAAGVLSAVKVGSTTLTATKDDVTSNTVDVDVSAAVITSIQVTPSPINIAKGQTQQLVATATYSDGTSADIANSVTWYLDTYYATVDSAGLLSGVEVGSTILTATKGGLISNKVDVDVSAAIITSIQVTPSPVNVAKGQTEQLTATATFSDGTSSDITSSVTWYLDTYYATVDSAGLLSGVEVGNTTTLTATKDDVTSNTVEVNVSAAVITSIEVTPSPVNLAKGQTQQLVATATYSDGTSTDIANSVTWTLVDTNTATVTAAGLLSPVEVGSTTLTATKDEVTSNTVTVNVSAAIITSIQVTPSSVSVVKGQTQQLVATATYSDGTPAVITNSVTWQLNTYYATVTAAGVLSGVEVGYTTLAATKDGVISNTVDVNVSAAVITSIEVKPSPVRAVKGKTQQLVAMATYSDGTSADIANSVTWTLVDTNIATVTSAGLLSGVEMGSTTLTAYKDDVTSNTVEVNVCDLADACIDIFDTGTGKLFTNSPSKAYLDSINGSAATNGTSTEDGTNGPSGDFYRFTWTNANALCSTYNTKNIGGRTNWRLATKDELKVKLFGRFGNMFEKRGWPTSRNYWSATPDGSVYYYVRLFDGFVGSLNPLAMSYASCVSDPES